MLRFRLSYMLDIWYEIEIPREMNVGLTQFMDSIRSRFISVESCPYSGGPRIYLENAGGSLTLESVVEVSARFASIPDNAGRPNPASVEIEQTMQVRAKYLLGNQVRNYCFG